MQQVGREGILAHSIDGLFEFESTAHDILHFFCGPGPLADPWPKFINFNCSLNCERGVGAWMGCVEMAGCGKSSMIWRLALPSLLNRLLNHAVVLVGVVEEEEEEFLRLRLPPLPLPNPDPIAAAACGRKKRKQQGGHRSMHSGVSKRFFSRPPPVRQTLHTTLLSWNRITL